MIFRFFCFFFQLLTYVYFNEDFVKKIMKKPLSFNANFQNLFQGVV